VPKNAVWSVLIAVVVLDLVSLGFLGNGLDSFTWWANALVFFAALTFLSVNVASTCYFWRRAREKFSVVKNLAIPVIGVIANAYLLYEAFFSSLWSGDWRTGKSVVVACTVMLVLEAAFVFHLCLFRRHLLHRGAPMAADSRDGAKRS
jgi:amino acid transporter